MAPSVSSSARTSRFFRLRYLWLLVVVIGYGVSVAMHWDDRAVLWIKEASRSQAVREASVWLPGYHAVIDAKPLPGMEGDEASDLTFNPATGSLFAVMGKHPFLAELSLTGDVLRKMPLHGWSNPEGVAALDDGRLVIVDERMHMATFVTLDANTRELSFKDFPSYDLGPSSNQNKAFEGVVWDGPNQRLLLGEERPAALFALKLDASGKPVGDKQRLPDDALDLRNLSALALDPRTHHLLALSAESHMLLEVDEQGQQTSFMTLLGGFNGLGSTIPRAEGVTIDSNGTLYMVSEPNLFYTFKKQ